MFAHFDADSGYRGDVRLDRRKLSSRLLILLNHSEVCHSINLLERLPGSLCLLHKTSTFIRCDIFVISIRDCLELVTIHGATKLVNLWEDRLSQAHDVVFVPA